MKKVLVVLLFAAVIGAGAFAQLMIGVSGALHMDDKLTAQQIKDRFDSGEGIFYGPSIEIAGKHLGVGVTANISSYEGNWSGYVYDSLGNIVSSVSNQAVKFSDYDLTLYLAYHLFGGHAFLDPFGEFGGGILATGFQNSSDNDSYNPYDGNFLMASYYWYAALGLGINLGPIGIFGKFSFNYPLNNAFQANWKGDTSGPKTDLYPYGYDPGIFLTGNHGYLPKFRFTAGVKLIL